MLGDVDTDAEALGVDIREVLLGFFGILVGYVQTDMIQTVDFHFLIDGARHDVARSQTEPLVILLHKLLAVRQTQNTSVTTHGLGNEVGRMSFSRVVQGGRVELYEFHALYRTFGTVNHGDSVACRDIRVGGCGVNGSCSSGGNQSHFRQEGVDLLGVWIENIRTVALNVRSAAGHFYAQMMLRDDFYGKMVFQNRDIRFVAYCLHQAALDLKTRVIGMV